MTGVLGMSKTSAYDALTPAVRELVDRKAEEYVAANGGDIKQVREGIASRVETRTYRPTHGRGH
jgi:hypothetical protein